MKIWDFIKHNIYVKNLLLLALIIFLLLFFLIWWLGIYTRHGQVIVVPNVKGLTIQQATDFFEKNKLQFEVVDSVYNKTSLPGTIVETIPTAGTKVKENKNIYITINAYSSQTGILPDVTVKEESASTRHAITKLKSAGFKNIQLKYMPGYSDEVLGLEYKGRAAKPGIRLPLESELTLLVGDGSGNTDDFEKDSIDSESPEINVDESWIY